MSHILDEITKTSIQLMLKEPFYGHFFSRLLKDTSESTKSIALSLASNQMMKLLVNPEYWQNPLIGIKNRISLLRPKNWQSGTMV